MKKLLLFASAFILTAGAFAQSNPFTPGSGALPAFTVGVAYSTQIAISVPATTTIHPADINAQLSIVPDFTASVDTAKFTVTGLPAGLTATFDNGTGIYLGGTTGTVTISGTPTSSTVASNIMIESLTSGSGDVAIPIVGTQNITFPGPLPVPIPGAPSSIPAAPKALDGGPYTMGTVGVQELNVASFDVIQNVPNPFTGNTQIKFSLPAAANVDFAIFDMIGKRVHSEKIQGQAKSNVINFNADKLANGTYFYSLTNGSKTITKKMIVAGK